MSCGVLEEQKVAEKEAYVEQLRQVGGCGDCGYNDEVGSGGCGEGRGDECELHDCDLLRLTAIEECRR